MTDCTKPLLLGYLRKHLLMTETELTDAKERLARFAELEGFALGTVYVELLETVPAAFEALVEAVSRYKVTAVVIPSMLHFAVLSAPAAIKDHFEYVTGAQVLIANSAPSRSDKPVSPPRPAGGRTGALLPALVRPSIAQTDRRSTDSGAFDV